MGGVLQQERHTVAAGDGCAALGDEIGGLDGCRQRQRHARIERMRILAGNGLEAEMLAVPQERPARLEAIEQIEVSGVAPVRGADGELDAVHDDRQGATSLLCRSELVRQQIERAAAPLPAKDFRRDLDKIDRPAAIDLRRQILEIRQPDAEGGQVRCELFMDDGYRAVTDEIGRRRVGTEINPQQGHAAAPSAARQAADSSQNALHCLHLLVFWVERDRRILPCSSKPRSFTLTLSPSLTTAVTFCTRRGASWLMCTRPSLAPKKFTNAPKSMTLTTVPS